MEFAVGHFLDLKGDTVHRWQNFFIKENVGNYSFLPFGFSGLTTNRQGDNIDATLVFPNNEISRRHVVNAVKDTWVAEVQVILFNPADKTDRSVLHTYVGQVTASSWSESTVNVRLNSLLDAVGSDVPSRRISQQLVGSLPTTANIQLF